MLKGFMIRYELLGILCLLIVQTLGAVWWASGASTTLGYLKQEILSLKTSVDSVSNERYKTSDAIRDFAMRDLRITEIEREISVMKIDQANRGARLAVIEAKLKIKN